MSVAADPVMMIVRLLADEVKQRLIKTTALMITALMLSLL
jgi:hypothetical protein